MMNYENPEHDGNSPKWHTGKACVEKGCKKPAGTWWSPAWCFDHNVERMKRVSAGLDDAVKRAEIAALIDKETASLRNWAFEMSRTIKAMVLASGGKEWIVKNLALIQKMQDRYSVWHWYRAPWGELRAAGQAPS